MTDDWESAYGNAAGRVESDDMTREGNTDRNRAIARARVLLDRDPVVIDTETTGVGSQAEVCEIAIVGRTGETVVDTLVRPGRPIPSEATRIHGITNANVADARSFDRVESDEFPGLLSSTDRAIAIYNAEYDLRLLDQSSGDGQGSAWRDRANAHCIMELYAMYRGEWSDRHGSYTWQSLSEAALQCVSSGRVTLTRRWLTREWRSVCCGTWRAARLAEGGGPCNAEQSAGLLSGATDSCPGEVM